MAGTAPFAFTLMLLVLSTIYTRSSAKPSAGPAETALGGGHRTRARSLTMFYSPARRYVRPLEQDVLDDDDESAMDAAKGKRQFDDYGHLRFGKRGDDQFDDYGHMRFGRSLDK